MEFVDANKVVVVAVPFPLVCASSLLAENDNKKVVGLPSLSLLALPSGQRGSWAWHEVYILSHVSEWARFSLLGEV